MKFPGCVFMLPGLLVLGFAICIAQTPAKEPTASIAGHVTVGGKSAAGVTVVATQSSSFFENKTVAKTTTDDDGNYKLNGLPAGQFTILPLTKSYLVANGAGYKEPGQSVNVTEGETITKIDFALVRGGVITGRITDAEGHPLISERVSVMPKDAPEPSAQMYMLGGTRNQTDDRGIYRVYGLGPGNYNVSVGQASAGGGAVSIMGMGGSQYLKTYFPGVEDKTRASIVEIKEGSEIKNVDITVNKAGSGFAVSGRVIDAESGAPVASVYIWHSTVDSAGKQVGARNFTGNQSDANGKFRLEGLRPGRYSVYTFGAGQQSADYSESVTLEVTDSDVTDIEIKVRRGATLSGLAVIENNSDPAVAALLQTVTVYAYVEQKDGSPSYAVSPIGPDGRFRIVGMAPGRAKLGVQGFPTPPKGMTLVRTELDGLDQKEGIELSQGAQITGVRLVFAYGTGSVRGDIRLEGGELPQGMTLNVMVRSPEGESHSFRSYAQVDARLHFVVEAIPPGSYELVVTGMQVPGGKSPKPVEFVKQTVTVTNGTETKVNLVVDVAKAGGQP